MITPGWNIVIVIESWTDFEMFESIANAFTVCIFIYMFDICGYHITEHSTILYWYIKYGPVRYSFVREYVSTEERGAMFSLNEKLHRS